MEIPNLVLFVEKFFSTLVRDHRAATTAAILPETVAVFQVAVDRTDQVLLVGSAEFEDGLADLGHNS